MRQYNKWILINPPYEFNIFVLQQQQNLGPGFGTSKMHSTPSVALAAVRSKAVVSFVVFDSLLIVAPIVGF